MQSDAIRKIIIVGGGTSGWMTAAALSKFLDVGKCSITLVESDDIGTVGVGEATLPHLRFFNDTLGIDESDFMRATNATYKTGIEFSNWGRLGDAYLHPFGYFGQPIHGISFHHFFNALKRAGYGAQLEEFSLPVMAARAAKFEFPSRDESSVLSTFSYAFHLDASLYAKYLRQYCEKNGVVRVEGKITQVRKTETEFIESVCLESGKILDADLFIDSSGFRSLLLGDELKVDFVSWKQWLPCNRAIAVPSTSSGALLPYTKALARQAGWQWRIPLQNRIGNGHVFCSEYLSEDEASSVLLESVQGQTLAEPNFIRFEAGHRRVTWKNNCVAVGLAGGFLEPLESTSIYLIQIAITKLIELFPDRSFSVGTIAEFNRQMELEFEKIRDLLILHYHATERSDSEFWKYCKHMAVPDELRYKIDLYKSQGHIIEYEDGLFLEPSWLAVFNGQHIDANAYDPRVNSYSLEQVQQEMEKMRADVAGAVAQMSKHSDVLSSGSSGRARASLNLYGRGR